MALKKFWVMAYRDLVRNRRRTIITFIAIAMGLTLVIFMNGLISGIMANMLQDTIRLDTGHIQLRADSYEEVKTSLLWRDLLVNPDELAAQAKALPQVKGASPILWAGGVLGTASESTSVRVSGIDTTSAVFDPVREGLREGEFLSENGRREILIGQRLANELNVGVGDRISLTVGNPDGVEEGIFTIVGLINTGFPGIDNNNVFLNLTEAQNITGSGNRASTVRILLHNMEDTESVIAALRVPSGVTVFGWEELNAFILTYAETGTAFYGLLYAIIFLVVAVIIANTLLMSVFERTREVGILAALGMKGRQIMTMFLFEATILGLVGSVFGIILGGILVWHFSNVGIYFGDIGDMVGDMPFGSSLYTALVPINLFIMAFWMMVVILVVSLYPAWYAARLEPVEALHAL